MSGESCASLRGVALLPDWAYEAVCEQVFARVGQKTRAASSSCRLADKRDEGLGAPAAEPPDTPKPETPVHIPKARPWLAALQDYQLLAAAKTVGDQQCLWSGSRSKRP